MDQKNYNIHRPPGWYWIQYRNGQFLMVAQYTGAGRWTVKGTCTDEQDIYMIGLACLEVPKLLRINRFYNPEYWKS
jgi:hypothetical protein